MGTLIPPEVDVTMDPTHADLTGEIHDDDGLVLDEYFEANPGGPVQLAGIVSDPVVDALPVTTRLMTRVLPLTPDGPPVLAFPANDQRKALRIVGRGTDATFGFRIAAALSDCYGAGRIPSGEVWGIDSEHTGAVWLYCAATDAPSQFNVNVEQVTL